MAMPKSNIRSFRYSDRVKEILESQKGDSLNEKFERLVLFCFDRVPFVEKRLADLEKEIERRNEQLYSNKRTLDQIDWMCRELETARRNVELATRRAKSVADGDWEK